MNWQGPYERMNYLSLIRQAKQKLEHAYNLAQQSSKSARVESEDQCIEAQKKISQAITELRKDSHES